MKEIIVNKEKSEEILAVFAEYFPEEEMRVTSFNDEFDEIVLAMGQDKDYAISYWDENNEECGLCLGAMNERDAEDRFNGMFPGNIFISAKEIKI